MVEINKTLLEKAEEITLTDYKKASAEDIISDLIDIIKDYKRKLQDIKQDIEDNYKPISVSEQYEISDRNFI